MTPEQWRDELDGRTNDEWFTVRVSDVSGLLASLDAAEARAERELGEKMDQAAVHYGGAIEILTRRVNRAEADAERLLLRLVYAANWLVPEHRRDFANEEIAAHGKAVKQRPLAADPKTALSTVQEMPDPYKEAARRQAVDET